jgi:hypothetical protein
LFVAKNGIRLGQEPHVCRARIGVAEMGGERWKSEAKAGFSLRELS